MPSYREQFKNIERPLETSKKTITTSINLPIKLLLAITLCTLSEDLKTVTRFINLAVAEKCLSILPNIGTLEELTKVGQWGGKRPGAGRPPGSRGKKRKKTVRKTKRKVRKAKKTGGKK